MFSSIKAKVQTWETIEKLLNDWQNETVVFTNGCFDILHYGHIHYLAEAKGLGDRLVIGLNSKDSVSRLKGKHRPINDDLTRIYLLAALECVDAVIVFEEDTPYNLIELVQPDILVKGGDYEPKNIVGADIVWAKGGQVLTLPFVKGYSTTNIEEKIKNS